MGEKMGNEELLNVIRKYIQVLLSEGKYNEYYYIICDSNNEIVYLCKGSNYFQDVNIVVGEKLIESSLDFMDKVLLRNKEGLIVGYFYLLGNKENNIEIRAILRYIGKLVEEEQGGSCKGKLKAEAISNGAKAHFRDIIGESEEIQKVIEIAKKVANSPSTILIEGESGTGKELLAQSIHNYSNRCIKRFVAINCGAIPNNIMESELFGYEEGTFTGGKKGGKIGKFEAANGGTLFLDEIGEMPLEMQVKLLRVLQENKLTRLGGTKEISINIRIIAATNKNLLEEVAKGTFREDLYYRICVIPIKIPPLRDRKGDIQELIEYFVEGKSIMLNKPKVVMDNDLYRKLLQYSWPGNIRQLENYIENIVNLSGELSFNLDFIESNSENNGINFLNGEKIDDYNLHKIEKQVIEQAILSNKNNLTRAAKELGISRNTLYLKMKKYNL